MQTPNKLQRLLIDNWRPKLICLVLAILVWGWVEYRYVSDEEEEWDLDDVKVAIPD